MRRKIFLRLILPLLTMAPMTEVLAQANATAPKTYMANQTQQDELIQRVPDLKYKKIQKIIDCTGNKQKGKLVFITDKGDTSKKVWGVYYIQNDYQGNKKLIPPTIGKIIYHDLGDNSFLGIEIQEEFLAKNNNTKTMIREVKLDDKSAQYLIDFIAGDSEFIDDTWIRFNETKNPNLKTIKIID